MPEQKAVAYHPGMAERTFFINAPIDQARAAVLNVFTSEGWAVAPFSSDTVQISRGKKGLSIAFGALMGSEFYLSQNLQFATGPQGETMVRYLSSTGSAFIGGAIGMRNPSRRTPSTSRSSPMPCSPRASSWACSSLRHREHLFLTHRHFLHR